MDTTCKTLSPSDLRALRSKHAKEAEVCLTAARSLVALQEAADMSYPLCKLDVHVALVLCSPKQTHHSSIASVCKDPRLRLLLM